MKSPLLLSALFLAATVAAAEEPTEMINKTTCTKGGDVRDLEIVASGDGHSVNYTKAGTTKEVGTCSMTKERCQKIFDNIKSNLAASGFDCKT